MSLHPCGAQQSGTGPSALCCGAQERGPCPPALTLCCDSQGEGTCLSALCCRAQGRGTRPQYGGIHQSVAPAALPWPFNLYRSTLGCDADALQELLTCVRGSFSVVVGRGPFPIRGNREEVGGNAAAEPEVQLYTGCTNSRTCTATQVQLFQHSYSPSTGNEAGFGCTGAKPTVPSILYISAHWWE